MYCPSSILVNNDCLWIHLKTPGDFTFCRYIPLRTWLNPLNYEVGFGGAKNSGRPIMINRSWRRGQAISNWIYAEIRPRLCQYLGVHQRMRSRGKPGPCHHCEKFEWPDA